MKRAANAPTTPDTSFEFPADGHAYPVNPKSQGKRVRVGVESAASGGARPFPPTPSSPNNGNEDGNDVTKAASTEPKGLYGQLDLLHKVVRYAGATGTVCRALLSDAPLWHRVS